MNPIDRRFKTIIEPFKIKMAEPIPFTTRRERAALLKRAGYNLFNLPADKVTVDLLTDSGTGAMSVEQWAALLRGDEAYAGATSFRRLEDVVRRLTGFRHVLPVHQGRAAEKLLFSVFGGPGTVIPNNSHFDTTRAHVETSGAEALDLPAPQSRNTQSIHPFKGDMDLAALERLLKREGHRIPLVTATVTNNSAGGQPVSMGNLKGIRRLCTRYGKPFFLDAARFAENAYFIKTRERGYAHKSVRAIAEEMFRLADGCWISAKKDGMVNIGGLLAFTSAKLLAPLRNLLILNEGFTTYGGMAGRDLEALAQGLTEVTGEDYLRYRAATVAYLGRGLETAGVPVLKPFGGHAVYVDARAFLPAIPPWQFPGQAFAAALYLEGGIRAVEIGSLMFGRRSSGGQEETPARQELVRLALPRRVYTQAHVDYCIEVAALLARERRRIRGLRIVTEAPILRHFTARLAPLPAPRKRRKAL
ncbi:MAG: tryptophanase [Planctomycetes bacterium]|nr:tryptophanase [Planctomycetota bacterium]